MIDVFSIILGLSGLAGVFLTTLMYINPRWRVDWYLNNPEKWEKITLDLNGFHSLWRHKKHPEFTIEETKFESKWDYSKTESWMKYPLPDPSKATTVIHIKVGGVIVYVENFISLDGGRYFVPLPRVKYHEKEKDNEYYYLPLQIKIARVIGVFYRMASIDEFVEKNEIEVRQK